MLAEQINAISNYIYYLFALCYFRDSHIGDLSSLIYIPIVSYRWYLYFMSAERFAGLLRNVRLENALIYVRELSVSLLRNIWVKWSQRETSNRGIY